MKMKKHLLACAVVAGLGSTASLSISAEDGYVPAAQIGYYIAQTRCMGPVGQAFSQGAGGGAGGVIGAVTGTAAVHLGAALAGAKVGLKVGLVGGVVGAAIGTGVGAV